MEDFWDESEFNFFSSLSDEDKLYYIYDITTGEYEFDDIVSNDLIDDSLSDVEITITDSHIIITCEDSNISKKFISSFVADGLILEYQQQTDTSIFYRIIGKTENMSVN